MLKEIWHIDELRHSGSIPEDSDSMYKSPKTQHFLDFFEFLPQTVIF